MNECRTMKNIMLSYEATTDQAVNFGKTGIYFSMNVAIELQYAAYSIFGVKETFG